MITVLTKKDLFQIDDRHLKLVGKEEIKAVKQSCQLQRAYNRLTKGYSKRRTLAAGGDIPAAIYWDKRYAFIFHNPDKKERERLTRKFLETNSVFKTHDRRLI